MLKKLILLLLTICMLFCLSACGTTETQTQSTTNQSVSTNSPKDFEYEEVSGGLKITQYIGSNTKVVVPEMIDNKKVVSVETAFSGNLSIEEVELPSSVERADFKNCEALKRLEAKGILYSTEINLSGCESLEYLALPAIASLPDYDWKLPKSIRELVLSGVTEFRLFRFPDSLSSLEILDISSATLIRTDYYSWPSKLKEVKINESITKYYISSDTGTVGGVLAEGVWDDSETLDIIENKESSIWCDLFNCEEIKVNGVTYKKS